MDFTFWQHLHNIFVVTKWSFYFGWKDYPKFTADFVWYDGLNYCVHIGPFHWEAH